MKNVTVIGMVAFLLATFEGGLLAQDGNPPNLVSYQGYLTGADGNPLAAGGTDNFAIEFRIYEAEEGGDSIWSELQTVTIADGSFSVFLGQGEAIGSEPYVDLNTLFDSTTASDRYIGLTVDDLGSEIAPRLRFLASPYAYLASKAIAAESLIGGTLLNTTDGEVTIAQDLSVTGTAGIFANGLWSTDGDLTLGNYNGSSFETAMTIEGSLGDVTIGNDLSAGGDADFDGSGNFGGDGDFGGNGTIAGILRVGSTTLGSHEGDLGIADDLFVQDNSILSGYLQVGTIGLSGVENHDGDVLVGDDLFVDDDATLGGTVTAANFVASGSATVGSFTSEGSATLESTLTVSEQVNLNGKVLIGSGANSGNADEDGDLVVDKDLVVEDDVIIADNLDVGDTVTVSNDLVVSDTTTLNKDVTMNDKLLLKGADRRTGTGQSDQSDSLRFYSHDGGSIWSVGPTQDAGNTDDELSFSYYNGSSWEGIGYLEPTSDAWLIWSDRRLKKDIEPMGDGVLDALMNVPPVRYRKKSRSSDSRKLYGFIAQDVAAAFPEFVNTTNEYLALDYARFSVFTLAGLQELRREKDSQIEELAEANEALKRENEGLKSQFDALLSRLSALEAKVQ